MEFGEEFAEPQDFLEILGGEPGVSCEPVDLGRIEFHVRTECVPGDERVSGTMSFQVGTQRLPGRLSER
jgi:hypothetical protein